MHTIRKLKSKQVLCIKYYNEYFISDILYIFAFYIYLCIFVSLNFP